MLNEYRKQIDEIDRNLIKLISDRVDVVKKVGEYKKENNMPALQPARWQQVVDSKKAIAKEYGIDENIIENIWNQLHRLSLDLEDKIIEK